ncbi:MAG TPA: capsule assembly Wzi family protein [Candidatus Angelobacter sp.]|nr:capsule assembly Wzi family protein [Candidatus Angelobacter sp.]
MTFKKVFLNLPGDQKTIWISPFRLRWRDSLWAVPLAGATGVMIGSDQHSMERARSNAAAISRSKTLSDAGVAGLTAFPAALWAYGSWTGNARQRETGLLSGEALINSLAVNEALKLVFARQRPLPVGGQGKFFTDVSNNASFPSMHSMLAWTSASVIAHEYPGPLTQILAYGAAATVSVSRVTGRQHFPSDVVVGGALGWMIGHQVYKAHHDPEIDAPSYGTFQGDPKEFDPDKLGSVYVPLDSWVYPALERLAALGYIKSQFTGLRPWTARECYRQIEEAEYFAQAAPQDSEIGRTLRMLRDAFKEQTQYQSFSVDSVYSGYTNISGSPLRDSYHFGQTMWNDYGRPYDQGGNFYSGASMSAVVGRFFWYARGEYQHAPGRPALTTAQQDLLNARDFNDGPPDPVGPAPAAVSTTNRFYPLDMYAGVQLGEYAVTFGKQSLWLGPGQSGPLMLSDNADPMYMLRLSRTTPLVLPWILRHLGEIKGEFLFSKLSGHQFPARPFFNLQKISFHPTRNLEIGFTRASLWGGVGHPFTLHALERNFLALGDTPGSTFDNRNDIGDRKSGFDFSYRLPGLRNWLTLYGDSYSDDDPSPLANPRRAALSPGLYLSHFPGIAKLDFRVEAVSTQSLTAIDRGGAFLYWNFRYHDSNTNKGYLFGNQTGRDGRTYQAWTTYHFSPATSLQFSYRDTKTSSRFLPGGGTQSDASTRLVWQLRPNWSVDALIQYERWLIPALRPTAQQDVTGRLQLTYTPRSKGVLAPKR